MPGKGKMPPELLAHFKKKSGQDSVEEAGKETTDKERRKEAVKKARVRIEKKKSA